MGGWNGTVDLADVVIVNIETQSGKHTDGEGSPVAFTCLANTVMVTPGNSFSLVCDREYSYYMVSFRLGTKKFRIAKKLRSADI